MYWLKLWTQWIVSVAIATAPLASRAQSAAPAAGPVLLGAGDVQYAYSPERTRIIRRDSSGNELVSEFRPSKEAELRRFSPSNMQKSLSDAIKAVGPVRTMKQKLVSFGPEAGLFFVAIGGVTMFQLATDYSSNPVRMQQHIEHSFSPVGMFSFYSFMYANGVTTNALHTVLKNPKFHSFIPYLGMTAGFFVQSAVSTFAADPNVKACVAEMMGKKKGKKEEGVAEDPCDAAFSYYAIKGKLYELAPGLISMIGSTFIAGLLTKGVIKGTFWMTGIDIAFLFIPGVGLGIATIRFLVVNAIQMALFYYLDAGWLNRHVTTMWKNIFDGRALANLDREISLKIAVKKKTAWGDQMTPLLCKMARQEGGCDRDLNEALKDMHSQLANWRMSNLMDVYEAHQNWQAMLTQLSSQYNVTYDFYRDLVGEVRNSKWKISNPQRLDIADPLFGVTAKGLAADKAALQYINPLFTQNMASATARDVGAEIQRDLESGEYRKKHLYPPEIAFLQKLSEQLQSNDVEMQGRALQMMSDQYNTSLTTATSVRLSHEIRDLMIKLGGNVQYLPDAGRGFLARFETYSPSAPLLKELSFPQSAGQFLTPRATDYLIVQTICGPDVDKGEHVIAWTTGFPARFLAPRLVNGREAEGRVCGMVGQLPTAAMHRLQLPENGKMSKGVIGYLKDNVKPEVLGDQQGSQGTGFQQWWEKKTQAAMKASFAKFSEKYEDIVRTLLKSVYRGTDSSLNMGPVANGTLVSMRQQLHLDLMILGEILKDLHEQQLKRPLPATFFSSRSEPAPSVPTKFANSETLPLMTALRMGGNPTDVPVPLPTQTTVLEWSRLNNAYTGAKDKVFGYPLQIQKEIEYEFEQLVWMLSKIRVAKQADGTERIVSELENADLEAQSKKIADKMNVFAEMLGIGESKAPGLVQLPTGEMNNLAMTAIEGLQTVVQEIYMYGVISNAVSWDKIQNLKGINEQKEKMDNAAVRSAQKISETLNAVDDLDVLAPPP